MADGLSGLQVIDVSNPASPNSAGNYDTPGEALDVHVSGNYAFVADSYYSGLQIIDISSPSDPILTASYAMPSFAWAVFVSGDYAFVANYDFGLRIINISSPSRPVQAAIFDTPGIALGVYVSGMYAYVADYDSGLEIIDISDPSNPALVGAYNTPGAAIGVFSSSDYIYIADYFSLIVLRLNPTGIECDDELPKGFSLLPNFPNPFNSSVTISYSLAQAGPVAIDIYNITGRKVARVLSGYEEAGEHIVVWDARDVSSGVYFARLKGAERQETVRMILLK